MKKFYLDVDKMISLLYIENAMKSFILKLGGKNVKIYRC